MKETFPQPLGSWGTVRKRSLGMRDFESGKNACPMEVKLLCSGKSVLCCAPISGEVLLCDLGLVCGLLPITPLRVCAEIGVPCKCETLRWPMCHMLTGAQPFNKVFPV